MVTDCWKWPYNYMFILFCSNEEQGFLNSSKSIHINLLQEEPEMQELHLNLDGAYKGNRENLETHSQQIADTYTTLLLYKWASGRESTYYTFNNLLQLKWIAVLHKIDQFLLWICATRHSKVVVFFPESCMKKGQWRPVICNYKQPHKNPCVSSMKIEQNVKDSLCYNETIYVHLNQDLWIFFVYVEALMQVHCVK